MLASDRAIVPVREFAERVAQHSRVAHGWGSSWARGAVGAGKLLAEVPDVEESVDIAAAVPVDWTPADVAAFAEACRGNLAIQLGKVRNAPEGSRNNTLNAVAWHAGRPAALGGRRTEVEQLLVAAGMAAGLSESECRATVRSALRGLE